MPYKAAGYVKNASREAVLNLDVTDGAAHIVVYTTALYKDARVVLTAGDKVLYDHRESLSPVQVLEAHVPVSAPETELCLSLYDETGRKLLTYQPQEKKIERIPDPMPPAKVPEDISTVEELYLTGLHIEQYRHATYLPDPYYLEALKRDPGDSRSNTAYGQLLLRRGQFSQAEMHFRRAIQRLTDRNPQPLHQRSLCGTGAGPEVSGTG